MCGPSSMQESEAGAQENLSNSLTAAFNQNQALQQAELGKINSIISPIASAGPSQEGFSAQEKAALNTQAINSSGAAARNATQAIQGSLAGRGGDSGLESGVDQQIVAGVKSQAANNLANTQDQITQADFQQGNQNFWRAQGAQQALANAYNPESFGSTAVSGGSSAFGEASEVQNEKNQEESEIAGAVTGAATDALTFGVGGMDAPAGESFLSGGFKALAGQ
jgi:hypothetical protein